MDELWPSMVDLFKDFSQHAMGIRASGAAAVNLCHLAAGRSPIGPKTHPPIAVVRAYGVKLAAVEVRPWMCHAWCWLAFV